MLKMQNQIKIDSSYIDDACTGEPNLNDNININDQDVISRID